ncbi:gastrula zinc finger protein xFG20-1-like [Anopheles ziemanni]|uniref:gastrula zinc finger protein xFG20-1-like n=1 Tax=Anopheles ziemanni TaxID=345580 RepID=UPI00265DA6D5|nr:gastrula zinc finger protein xFG20-1-like [Anopheles ziemanni]
MDICRVCMEEVEDYCSLFETIELMKFKHTAASLITECFGITVTQDDGLPEFVCNPCLQAIAQAYVIRDKCITSDRKMRKILFPTSRKLQPIIEDTTATKKQVENADMIPANASEIAIQTEPDYSEYHENEIKTELDHFDDELDVIDASSMIVYEGNLTESEPYEPPEEELTGEEKKDLQEAKASSYSDEFFEDGDTEPAECDPAPVDNETVKMEVEIVEQPPKHLESLVDSDGEPICSFTKREPQKNVCDICKQEFSSKDNLKSHLMLHSNERPFGCEICGRRFSKKGNYKVHLMRHSNNRSFPCTQCDMLFVCHINLKNHMRTHTGERPYPCKYCKKTFMYLSEIKRHEYQHTGDYPFVCTFCSRKFSRFGLLKHHQEAKCALRTGVQKAKKNDDRHKDINTASCVDCLVRCCFVSVKHSIVNVLLIHIRTFGFGREKDAMDICRVCMEEVEDYCSLFETIELMKFKHTAASLITECFGITVTQDDGLPEFVCNPCLQAIAQAYVIRDKCITSDRKMRKILFPTSRKLQPIIEDTTVTKKQVENADMIPANASEIAIQTEPDYSEYHENEIKTELDHFDDELDVIDASSMIVYEGNLTESEPYEPPEEELTGEEKKDLQEAKASSYSDEFFEDGDTEPAECDPAPVDNETVKMEVEIVEQPPKHLESLVDSDGEPICSFTKREPQKNVCDICKQEFSSKGNLKSHLMLHSNERPFGCEICGRRFSKKGNYKVHLMRHSNNRSFPCTQCDMLFVCHINLKNHMRTHTGERPYACKYCKKTFMYLSDIKRHEYQHTGDYPFVCTFCSRKFSRFGLLKHHQEAKCALRTGVQKAKKNDDRHKDIN